MHSVLMFVGIFGALLAAGADGERPAVDASRPAVAGELEPGGSTEVDPALEPYLGTWLLEEIEKTAHDSAPVERYILIRVRKGNLKVKTLDYFPERGTRVRESNWAGTIQLDHWNIIRQTFTPLRDGSISVGMAGTNRVGDVETTNVWWAAGRFTLEEGEDGENHLRFATHEGYTRSSKGNLYTPIDRLYRRLSPEADLRFDPAKRPRTQPEKPAEAPPQ